MRFILCLVLQTCYLVAMDQPSPQLDLTSDIFYPTPSTIITFHKDPQKEFDRLIDNKALLLKMLVAKEQQGEYCQRLHDAEEVLHMAFVFRQDENSITSLLNKSFARDDLSDPETMNFVALVAKRKLVAKKLIDAIDQQNIVQAKTIIKANPYVINAQHVTHKCYSITPLNYLLERIKNKYIPEETGIPFARLFLKKGANPNAMDCSNNDVGNSLHYASSPALIELLLSFGAKTNIKNSYFLTPLMNLIAFSSTSARANEKNSPIYSLVKSLLYDPYSSSINECDDQGGTALHLAGEKHTTDLVELLLKNGANCTLINKKNQTPWHVATTINKSYLANHLYTLLCNALKDDNTTDVRYIVEAHSPLIQTHPEAPTILTYVVKGISIIDWAKKYCRRKSDSHLHYSVPVFNQLLAQQFVDGGKKTDILIGAISINMMGIPSSISGTSFTPLAYAIDKKNISKIKILLSKGALIGLNFLPKIEQLENKELYKLACDAYSKQGCFNCHSTEKELDLVYDLKNLEVFWTCSACRPKDAQLA